MNRVPYNGWTNYETWACAMWLDNDEGTQYLWHEHATEILAAEDGDTNKAKSTLADILKEQHEEAAAEIMNGENVFADLLSAAMSEINWYEIAENMIASALEARREKA